MLDDEQQRWRDINVDRCKEGSHVKKEVTQIRKSLRIRMKNYRVSKELVELFK